MTQVGDAPSRPLHGARVANLASLWAGPLVADVLCRLGADVISIESVGRPTGRGRRPSGSRCCTSGSDRWRSIFATTEVLRSWQHCCDQPMS